MTEIEQAKRFSHLYVSRDTPLKDSKKARYRIAKLLEKEFTQLSSKQRRSHHTDHAAQAQNLLESEIGRQFRSNIGGRMYPSWTAYTQKLEAVDFLDAITVVASYLREWKPDREAIFASEANRIFNEVNMAYKVDSKGGIHPLVDGAFSAAIQSAIAALSGERYTATAELVDAIDKKLLQDPVDYIGAIRAIFGANENLFKLMFDVPRLDARTAGDKIGPKQQAQYDGHPTLQRASAKALEGFKDWIDAAHHYRHEQGVESPSQPNQEIGILLVSQGLGFVRWLAQLDAR